MPPLNVFAGMMRLSVKTRTICDEGNCDLVTPTRTFARSLMLDRTALRACTVPGWYPAPAVTPEESLSTPLAALSVVFCAFFRSAT